MPTSHTTPSRVNLNSTTVTGNNLRITAILSPPTSFIVDGLDLTALVNPIWFESPIECSSFTAPLGTIAYTKDFDLWTPANIEADGGGGTILSSWYDPSDSSTLNGIGAAGATMTDKSANNNTLTVQGTAANCSLTTLNGLGALKFDGSVYMDAPTANLVGGTEGNRTVSVLAVMEVAGAFGAGKCIYSLNATKDFEFRCNHGGFFSGGVASINIGVGTMSLNPVEARNGPSIYETYADSVGEFGIVIDGTLPGAAPKANPNADYNGKLDTSQAFHVFTNRNKGSFPKGICGEMLILDVGDRSLRVACEGYLAHKWGLAANLPIDHRFKNAAPST